MRFLLVAASLFVALPLAHASDQVFVEPATGSGVLPSDLDTATDLVKSAVTEVSSDSVTDQADKADFALRPKLLRLGAAYLMSLSKVQDGKEVFSSQLKAEKMDELDKVAQRLTRSVILGERASDNPRVGEITDQESHDGNQRRPTRKATYLGFGGASLANLNASSLGYSVALARAWDVNTVQLKILGEGDVSGDAFFASASLGADYFLSTTDFAPYVAADFGAGVAKIDGGGVLDGVTVGGFVVGAGAGVQVLRTAAVNLDLGLHAGFLLHSNAIGMPQSYTLRLGLYF